MAAADSAAHDADWAQYQARRAAEVKFEAVEAERERLLEVEALLLAGKASEDPAERDAAFTAAERVLTAEFGFDGAAVTAAQDAERQAWWNALPEGLKYHGF